MVFAEGNIECVEKLLKPAKRVLKMGMPIKHDAFERRVELWNKIQMNYESYLDEDCGFFLSDLDRHFRSLFDGGLLVLAASFKENGEFFGAADIFKEEEIELYRQIVRYDIFELFSVEDLRKKLVQKDDEVLDLLRDYYISMDSWVDTKLKDSSLRLTLRYFLKKKWDGYKTKLNEAVSTLVLELDWLKALIKNWENGPGVNGEPPIAPASPIKERQNLVKGPTGPRTGKPELQGKGSRYVKLEEVKQYELNFIGRIEHKLGDTVTFSGKPYKVDFLREVKQVDSSRFSEGFGLSALDLKSLPENRALLASFIEKKLLGKKERYNFKALFSSRVERYAESGYDIYPLGLKEVNAFLVDSRDEAREKGNLALLCLASPTGFEEAVGSYINSEDFHRNFLSKYLSVCLLDLDTGKQYYNPNDGVAKEFAKLCEMETETEKAEKLKLSVAAAVEDLFLMQDHVVFADIAKGLEALPSDIKPVFYEYAEERGFKVRFFEEVGLVMMKKKG